ncbi:hypothetical protein Rruber_05550 (plasmid) [Rhodococcus ruber]
MNNATSDPSSFSASERLASLYEAARQERGLTWDQLRRAVNFESEATLKRRLMRGSSNNSGPRLDEVPTFAEALGIAPDRLLRALLPALEDERSHILHGKRWQMRAQELEDELARRQAGEVQLDLVEDITATGRWAVGILPHRSGPSPEAEVLSGTRIAVTPARPGLLAPGQSVRAALIEEFGAVIRDRAVFLADHVRPRPTPPLEAAPDDVVYLSIPAFTRDRVPSKAPILFPKLNSRTVLVVALTQSPWRHHVAAIAARALGWGLVNSSSIERTATPPRERDRDDHIEEMNKLRNDGLARLLFDPPQDTFIHHVGRAVVGEYPEPHTLVRMIDDVEYRDRLPFVVLLTESDRVIARQTFKALRSDNGIPRFSAEQWTAWRDELRDAVEQLPPSHRLILPFDFPWEQRDDQDSPPDDPAELDRKMWHSNAILADKVLRTMYSLGGLNSNARPKRVDPEAERILQSIRPY